MGHWPFPLWGTDYNWRKIEAKLNAVPLPAVKFRDITAERTDETAPRSANGSWRPGHVQQARFADARGSPATRAWAA